MNPAKQPALHVVASEEDNATRRLHLLMRQRETLRPIFRATWDDLSHHFDPAELEAWAGAVLTLAHVNAGPACLIAYWDATKSGAGREEIAKCSQMRDPLTGRDWRRDRGFDRG